MHVQTLVVALLVLGCSLYAAWTLMPSAARRALAIALLRLPVPGPLAGRLRKVSQAAAGCGCDGCDRSALGPTTKNQAAVSGSAPQPITFHPRRH